MGGPVVLPTTEDLEPHPTWAQQPHPLSILPSLIWRKDHFELTCHQPQSVTRVRPHVSHIQKWSKLLFPTVPWAINTPPESHIPAGQLSRDKCSDHHWSLWLSCHLQGLDLPVLPTPWFKKLTDITPGLWLMHLSGYIQG